MEESKKMKHKIGLLCILLVAGLFVIYGGVQVYHKLTFVETCEVNRQKDNYISINTPEENIVQQFYMPYEIFQGTGILINTYSRDNNSDWSVRIQRADDKRQLYKWTFNASAIVNEEGYHELKCKRPIPVSKGERYEVIIESTNVNPMTSLAFGTSIDETAIQDASLQYRGGEYPADICFNIYGGDHDLFWISWYGVALICIAIFTAYLIWLRKQNRSIKSDKIVQAVVMGTVLLLLNCIWLNRGVSSYLDENDNMIGGLIISRGGVIYRDYITSHTPLAYYICGIFAWLGANSISQFRLLYYILQSILWGAIFLRNREYYGAKKMFVLPFAELVLLVGVITVGHEHQLLSDVFQGIFMVALILEFWRYREEKSLGWVRAIIVSLSVWGSIGVAFVSVYAISIIAIFFLVTEVNYWKQENKLSIKAVIARYWRVAVASMIPGILIILYFGLNGALRTAFYQAYTFNRDVYSKYIMGYGTNIIQPYFEGIRYYFTLIPESVGMIFQGKEILRYTVIILVTIITSVEIVRKKDGVFIFLLIAECGTRRIDDIHGIPAWYVIGLFLVLWLVQDIQWKQHRFSNLQIVTLLLIITPFVFAITTNPFKKDDSISKQTTRVIEKTAPGEKIYIQEAADDTLYLIYKDRWPVNRNLFCLPWYMDEYESTTILDIQEKEPNILIYDDKMIFWENSDYFSGLDTYIKDHYVPEEENLFIWHKK